MITYDIKIDISLIELNALSSQGWEVVDVSEIETNKLSVLLRQGYPDTNGELPSSEYTLVENTNTGAEFYINKSVSYGDAIIITFFTIFLLALLGKTIFHYFFFNE